MFKVNNKNIRMTCVDFEQLFVCLNLVCYVLYEVVFWAYKKKWFHVHKNSVVKCQKFTFWSWTEWRNGYSKQPRSYLNWIIITRIILQRRSLKLLTDTGWEIILTMCAVKTKLKSCWAPCAKFFQIQS